MEKLLTQEEILALKNEYYETKDKIRELSNRTDEIDAIIVQNSCNIVANRFIPLEFGDKIRITKKIFRGYNMEDMIVQEEGIFGSFFLQDRHPYTEDNGVGSVQLRLYQIKKDGTRSQKSNTHWAGGIVSIEKMED